MENLMSLQPYIRQLRPRNESYVAPVERIQQYLTEGSTEAAKEMEYLLVHVAKYPEY